MAFRFRAAKVVALSCGALIASVAGAQGPSAEAVGATAAKKPVKFAAPVRLNAGEKFMGEKRLYPSPVFQDMNGDGLADVVIGDLPGRITVALRLAGEGKPVYGAESALKGRDGKDLKFSNW